MTWQLVIFASFCVMVAAIFLFFTIVYLKEYAREEKIIGEYKKLYNDQLAAIMQGNPQVYLMEPATVKKKSTTAPTISTSKSKKNIN